LAAGHTQKVDRPIKDSKKLGSLLCLNSRFVAFPGEIAGIQSFQPPEGTMQKFGWILPFLCISVATP
jgi:hypothetical protein